MNPLRQLREHGQAPWIDDIDRRLLDEGGLERLVREDGLAAVTSNPTIFDPSISGGDDHEDDLCHLLAKERTGLAALSEALDG